MPDPSVMTIRSAEFIAPRLIGEFQHQQALRSEGVAEPYESTFVCRDGSEIPVLISPQPLFDQQGEYAGSFAVVSDVRVRRRTETERTFPNALGKVSV